MTVRETVVAPLGLITRPNETGQYPAGALRTALNVCMRSPGIVEPLPARSQYAANGGGSAVVQRLWPTASSILVHATSALWSVTNAARNAITLPSEWSMSTNPRFMRAKGREYVSTNGGPLSIYSTTASPAGLAQPASIDCTAYAAGGTSQALATARNVNYRAILTRRSTTGALLSSAPTNILNIQNNSGSTVAPDIRIRLLTIGHYAVGDVYELYRTESQASGTDPGPRFRLCGTHTLDAGDIAALSVTITDNCTDGNLGADLYTNPGQPTQSARHNRTPSYAIDMAMFKGYAFYATPYSHVRGRFKILGQCGVLGTAATRTHGIGSRVQNGDFTNGSPTVLNVTPTTGLKIGQKLQTSATVAANTTITNIVGTTLTLSQNATATSAGFAFYTYDRIDIHAVTYDFPSLEGLAENIAVDDVGFVMRTDAYIRQLLSGGSVVNVGSEGDATILFEDVYYAALGVGDLGYGATNQQNYSPAMGALTSPTAAYPFLGNTARITVSKFDQPEHVPEENELVAGSGYIYRLVATTDTLFVFTSAGLFAVEGDAGAFRVRSVDQTLQLASSSAVDVMLDEVWAYTNRGLVVLGPGGVKREVSAAVVGNLIMGAAIVDASTDELTGQLATFLTCDERNREVRLCIRNVGTSTIYLYNALTDKFTTIVDAGTGVEVIAECYAPYLESIVWAPSVVGANTPLYRYATDGTTRSDDAIRFQPVFGTREPFTLKQWSDFDFLFRNVGSSSLTLNTTVNGAQAYAGVTSTLRQDGQRGFTTGMTLADAMAPSASFGFDTASNGSAGWQLVGMSARWVPISQQVQK